MMACEVAFPPRVIPICFTDQYIAGCLDDKPGVVIGQPLPDSSFCLCACFEGM